MKLEEHPTVKRFRGQQADTPALERLDSKQLRSLVLEAGADDVGFVEIDRTELDDQRADILNAFPRTKTLISFVVRMNREPIRTPARSVANLEFHHTKRSTLVTACGPAASADSCKAYRWSFNPANQTG